MSNILLFPVFPTSTIAITFIEVIILFIGLFQLALNNDKSNKRFVVLTLMFLQYNIINGLLPNWEYHWVDNIFVSILFQNILAYSSGILLASYYFHYLIVELDIQMGRFFNVKFLLWSLFLSFLVLYCGTYLTTLDKNLARQYFIWFPCIIAVYFAYNTVRFIIKNRREKSIPYYRWISFSGYLGIMFMATMPIVLIWGDQNKGMNHLLVNVAMMLTVFSHLRRFIQLNGKKHPDLGQSENEKYVQLKSVLTQRELEVASLMVSTMNFEEIAEIMYVAGSTVRKHASNIYEKCSVSGRDEFGIKYEKIHEYLSPFKTINVKKEKLS